MPDLFFFFFFLSCILFFIFFRSELFDFLLFTRLSLSFILILPVLLSGNTQEAEVRQKKNECYADVERYLFVKHTGNKTELVESVSFFLLNEFLCGCALLWD